MTACCATCNRPLLTTRELTPADHRMVRELYALGYSIAEVARRVGITVHTARTHPSRLEPVR